MKRAAPRIKKGPTSKEIRVERPGWKCSRCKKAFWPLTTVQVLQLYNADELSRQKCIEILTAWNYGFTRAQADALLDPHPVDVAIPYEEIP